MKQYEKQKVLVRPGKIWGNFIISLAFFFTLFPVNFVFLPSGISSRVVIAIFGVIWYVYENAGGNYSSTNKNSFNIFFLSILIAVWSYLCTVIFNDVYDYIYVKHPFTILIMFLSTFFCYSMVLKYRKVISFEIVSRYFISAVLLQAFLTLAIFFFSSFGDFMNSIQRLGEREMKLIGNHLSNQTRFIGFGLMFYNASFFFGSALVFAAYLLRNETDKWRLVLFYVIIAFVGMGLSRSTMIGLFISIFVYIYPEKLNTLLFRRIIGIACFIFIIITVIYLIGYLLPDLNVKYKGFIDNVFDVFINYSESGEIDSKSAEGTFDTFRLPDLESTYLMGTGYYEQLSRIGDFSYTDIGYLRLLFYSGIIGLILFFLFEITLLKIVFYDRGYKLVFCGMLLILLITNIKGLTTLSVIALMFWKINIAPSKLK